MRGVDRTNWPWEDLGCVCKWQGSPRGAETWRCDGCFPASLRTAWQGAAVETELRKVSAVTQAGDMAPAGVHVEMIRV